MLRVDLDEASLCAVHTSEFVMKNNVEHNNDPRSEPERGWNSFSSGLKRPPVLHQHGAVAMRAMKGESKRKKHEHVNKKDTQRDCEKNRPMETED